MSEKRYWQFLLVILVCLSIWHITGPGPPYEYSTAVSAFYMINAANTTVFSYPKLPSDDYGRLMDVSGFEFKIINVCNNTSPLLLVLIHTSPTNYAKRKTIRDTWGQSTDNVKIMFMLGVVRNDTIMNSLVEENSRHKDLVQGNFLDTYRNMTYKHVMVFKYAIYHCPRAKYILKTDDDVFVNMPRMIDFLSIDLSPYGANNLLFCTPYREARVMRSYRSKWRVGFSEYPYRMYPPYCPGWALLYSPDILFALYVEVQKSKYFWIDDVLITGTLVKDLQIEHTEFEALTLHRKTVNHITQGTKAKINPFLYGAPDMSEHEIRALWKYVEKQSQNKSVFQNRK